VRTDEEIRQWHAGGLASARSRASKPVAPVGAATNGCGPGWKIKDGNTSLAHIFLDFFAAPWASIQFG
jgi:hypothetical protein